MPKNVVRYERLMLLAILVGVTSNIMLRGGGMIAKYGIPGLIISQVVAVSLFGFMIWLISRCRQNWARWIMVTLLVVGSPQWILVAVDAFPRQPVAALLTVIAFLMQSTAYYFVFTGDARDWFRPATKRAEQT